MSNYINDVCIVLQGYATSKKQLTNLVEHYIENGFNKIAISSYSDCVDYKEITKRWPSEVAMLLNDRYEKEGKYRITDSAASSTYGNFKPSDLSVNVDKAFPPAVHPQQLNLNFHILTTNRGIKLANEHFPNAKYYLKCRADVKLNDLHLVVNQWVADIEANKCESGDIFKNKLVASGSSRAWVIGDFWTFGTKEDISSYYNISYAEVHMKPETYLCSAYTRSQKPDMFWEEAKGRYWIFRTMHAFWYKKMLEAENKKQRTIYVDVDETICISPQSRDYAKAVPILTNIEKANKLYKEGHTIVYWTARGTGSGKDWREVTEKQFEEWGVKYHELKFGKPMYDLFIDDKNKNTEDWK